MIVWSVFEGVDGIYLLIFNLDTKEQIFYDVVDFSGDDVHLIDDYYFSSLGVYKKVTKDDDSVVKVPVPFFYYNLKPINVEYTEVSSK